MHALTKCCLLLLALRLASIAAELQKNTCHEAESGQCESDRSGFIQSQVLVQKIETPVDEQVWDKEKKSNQPVGAEPSLLEKKQELERNSSDKNAIPARLNSEPFSQSGIYSLGIKVPNEYAPNWLKDLSKNLAPFLPMRLSSELMVADDAVPDWLNETVKNFAPSCEPLEKSLDNIIKGAAMFSANAVECDSALQKANMANMANKTAILKVVQEGFACFATAVTKLAGPVKNASKTTVEFFKHIYLPEQALTKLVHQQELTTKSVDHLAARAIEVKEDMSVLNATTICAKISKSFASLEESSLYFIKAVASMNALTARGDLIRIEMKSFPKELKQEVQKLFDTMVKAENAIVEAIPKGLLDFRRHVVTTLTGRMCSASELPVLRAGASSVYYLGIPALFFSGILVVLLYRRVGLEAQDAFKRRAAHFICKHKLSMESSGLVPGRWCNYRLNDDVHWRGQFHSK